MRIFSFLKQKAYELFSKRRKKEENYMHETDDMHISEMLHNSLATTTTGSSKTYARTETTEASSKTPKSIRQRKTKSVVDSKQ
jgi:hypothetical protein